jgi:flavorubredoxin
LNALLASAFAKQGITAFGGGKMKPVEIAKGVYDVGVNDWNIEDFHGYSTPLGTSYNAFLIVDERVALIDTVKKEFADQLLANISEIIDPRKIDLLISNHTEMDHSGSLPRVMHRIGEDKPIYCSKLGQKNLSRHFYSRLNLQAVDNGQVLSLGRRTLTFLETRMVHWPDSMFSYCKEDKILFSSDGFGQHYAGFEKFDDVVGDAIMPHAKKYFANILMLYAPLILKLVDTVAQLGLAIDTICPDHGVIWRQDPARIISAYQRWGKQTPKRKAVLVYDTMWHSTEMMADAIATGINDQGIAVRPMYLRKWHRSDIMTEVLDAKAVVVGSPTLNNGLFPTVSDFLTYMKGLKPLNKIGGAFGSYGWSGEAVKLISTELEAMKFEIVEPVRHQYIPDSKSLEVSYDYGCVIGRAINEQVPA